jgi:hypothetical protein
MKGMGRLNLSYSSTRDSSYSTWPINRLLQHNYAQRSDVENRHAASPLLLSCCNMLISAITHEFDRVS